jgi:hypothetical protein
MNKKVVAVLGAVLVFSQTISLQTALAAPSGD